MSSPVPAAALSGISCQMTINKYGKHHINPIHTQSACWALHGATDPGEEESGTGYRRRLTCTFHLSEGLLPEWKSESVHFGTYSLLPSPPGCSGSEVWIPGLTLNRTMYSASVRRFRPGCSSPIWQGDNSVSPAPLCSGNMGNTRPPVPFLVLGNPLTSKKTPTTARPSGAEAASPKVLYFLAFQ